MAFGMTSTTRIRPWWQAGHSCMPAPGPLAKASARQRSNVAVPIPTSRDTSATDELSGGNNLATIRSLYACPYRATS